MLLSAVLSSPASHSDHEHMLGSLSCAEQVEQHPSPRAAPRRARGTRSRKSCSRRLVVATQHLNTKQGGSEVVSGSVCSASGRECAFCMCWCWRERAWRSTHTFPWEMVMLSWRYLCINKYEVVVLVESRNLAAGSAATAAPHASHGRETAPHGAAEPHIQPPNKGIFGLLIS